MVAPPAPALPGPSVAAAAVFGERLPLAVRYAQWLAGAGVERGLVGPRETDRLWDRHLLNCAAVGALIAPGSLVADIGSGAGLPGIALAIARPDLRVLLVESMLRRTAFLEEVVAELALTAVTVRRARAEDLRKEKIEADVVTARAIAPTDRLAGWAQPLLNPTGCVLALKGSGVAAEVESAWPTLRRLRLTQDARLFSIVLDRVLDSDSTDSFLPGACAMEDGHWEEVDGRAGFVPSAGSTPSDAVRLAIVVRLGRQARDLSRDPARGLG